MHVINRNKVDLHWEPFDFCCDTGLYFSKILIATSIPQLVNFKEFNHSSNGFICSYPILWIYVAVDKKYRTTHAVNCNKVYLHWEPFDFCCDTGLYFSKFLIATSIPQLVNFKEFNHSSNGFICSYPILWIYVAVDKKYRTTHAVNCNKVYLHWEPFDFCCDTGLYFSKFLIATSIPQLVNYDECNHSSLK